LLVCSQRERPFGWPVPKRGRNWGHQRICRLRRDTWQPDDVWHQPGGGAFRPELRRRFDECLRETRDLSAAIGN